MDDMDASERQLRLVLDRMAGPEPRFDALAIARTATTTSPGWVLRPAFSVTKLAVACASLAASLVLFAGLLSSVPQAPLGGSDVSEPAEELADIAFVQADYDQFDDETASRVPKILAVSSEGGAATTLMDVPGKRGIPGRGSFPNDPRNDGLVGPAVSWSPDGTRIAFRLFNDVPGIYLMDRDGSDLRRLVDLPRDRNSGMAFSAALDWSPDGTRIAYTYPYGASGGVASHLYVVDTDDGRVANLMADDPARWVTRTVGWSPDGSMIAFARTDRGMLPRASRLFVMNADGSGERELITGPEPYPQVYGLAWSPDGTSIAFVQDMGSESEGAPERGVLRVVNADGSGLRTLLGPWQNQGCCFWTSIDQPLAWSPDGASIAMIRWLGEDDDVDQVVVLVNADGSGERELMTGSWFAWSPDGSRLVVADAGGWDDRPAEAYSIHVIDADGSDPRSLAAGEYPAWAPRGAD